MVGDVTTRAECINDLHPGSRKTPADLQTKAFELPSVDCERGDGGEGYNDPED